MGILNIATFRLPHVSQEIDVPDFALQKQVGDNLNF